MIGTFHSSDTSVYTLFPSCLRGLDVIWIGSSEGFLEPINRPALHLARSSTAYAAAACLGYLAVCHPLPGFVPRRIWIQSLVNSLRDSNGSMRFLNTDTLTFKVFNAASPVYAILSHRWGSDEDELSFQELESGADRHCEKRGFDKVAQFCRVASQNGYKWVWADTCCIDKSSSAELSEAINSMYRWYKEADTCYAFLEDIEEGEDIGKSDWFTRGWTLQELLAPEVVEFYDSGWNEIGTKFDMRETISNITGIDADVLRGSLIPSRFTVALRMSWAANRYTTRDEDVAYSLLGIFDVHMPLLYGEGWKAFTRLQEEILKVSEDYTMLAWRNRPKGKGDMGKDPTTVLAKSPWDFRNDAAITQAGGWDYTQLRPIDWNPFRPRESDFDWRGRPSAIQFTSRPTDFEPPRKTARGLRVTLPFITKMSPSDDVFRDANLAFLYCYREPQGEMVCLVLHEHDGINSSGMRFSYSVNNHFQSSHRDITVDLKRLTS